jgi:hypothetical protein
MPGGARSGAGRKHLRINLGELEKLCGLNGTDEEIAGFFGVSVRTIERRKQRPAFADPMQRGRAKGRLSLRRKLFPLALEGNVAACIFLAKNLLGYRDVLSNEHSGPDGGPIRSIRTAATREVAGSGAPP